MEGSSDSPPPKPENQARRGLFKRIGLALGIIGAGAIAKVGSDALQTDAGKQFAKEASEATRRTLGIEGSGDTRSDYAKTVEKQNALKNLPNPYAPQATAVIPEAEKAYKATMDAQNATSDNPRSTPVPTSTPRR